MDSSGMLWAGLTDAAEKQRHITHDVKIRTDYAMIYCSQGHDWMRLSKAPLFCPMCGMKIAT